MKHPHRACFPALAVSVCLAACAASRVAGDPSAKSTVPVADAPVSPADAARALIGRVVPAHASRFSVEIIPPAENGHDVFEVESAGDKVVLRGNDGVSVASALNWYLKNIGHCSLSWCGDHIDLPAKPAPVPAKVRVVNPHKYRVMFNYCTLNYTCSWWDQKRWERELDFLAMQGVNTPLGAIGLEAVWYDTLLKHGFSDEEARAFLVGPAFSAWQWMTNIEGHGGPLPRSWIESHRALGKWWMARARSLGMTPIRQGFSGYVPRELKKKFPKAAVAFAPSWCGFPGSAQLDPLDPLFKEIGKTFLEESVRNYGEGHLWAADPFHESSPPRPGEKYLNDVGTAIFSLMRSVDPKATWAMMAWSIRKPITDSVPKGSLIVLDLAGGGRGYWGHDYVKGQLHNFGGRINLHGDLRSIVANPFAAQAARDPHCVGMGLFPEAIVQNPVFYEAVYDMMWRDKPVGIDAWLADYARRRYGVCDDNTTRAWKLLLDEGPYRYGTSGVEYSSIVAARPALDVKKSGPNAGFHIPYKPEKLVEAVDLLLKDEAVAGANDAYRHDIVDFTRQILSNLSQSLYREIGIAYRSRNPAAFDKAVADFEGALADIDTLLATRPEFLYGKWVADARSWGTTPAEKDLYEYNAAMLVTIWGPDPNTAIFDYSWREWSGLIREFYLPRWRQFHAMLRKSIDKGDYRDPRSVVYGRESFRANAFYDDLATWELAFLHKHTAATATPSGDPVAVAKAMLAKYRARLDATNGDAARQALEARRQAAYQVPLGDGIAVGGWKLATLKPGTNTLVFDLSAAVDANGTYDIAFAKSGPAGTGAVRFSGVALMLNGEKVDGSADTFVIGSATPERKIRVKSGPNLQNGKYELQVVAEIVHAQPGAAGTITVTKE